MGKSRSGTIRTQMAGAKNRLADALVEAKSLLEAAIPDQVSESSTSAIILEDYISKLDSRIKTVTNYDEKWMDLISSLEDADIDTEEALYASFAAGSDGYLELLAEAQELRAQLDNKLKRVRAATVPKAPKIAPAKSGTAKLPKIVLPKYDGDPMHWNQFIAIHNANIGTNAVLTNIEKLTYLRSQLAPTVLTVIEGLEITEESYDTAIAILTSRFERTSAQLIGYLYAQLKKIPASSDRVKDMRQTHDYCEMIFRQLKTAGQDVDANCSLTRDVMSKYPSSVIKDIIKRHGISGNSTVTQIQEALRKVLKEFDQLDEMMSDLEPFRSNPKKQSSWQITSESPNQHVSMPSYTKKSEITSALTAVADHPKPIMSPKPTEPASPCHMCGGAHFMAQCDKYSTAQQRVKRLEAVKRCGRCFSPTHVTAECRTGEDRMRCFYCDQQPAHKSALCPVKFSSAGQSSKTDATTNLTSAKHNTAGNPSYTSSPKTGCGLSFNEHSLLPTATTMITNPRTGKQRRMRLVLDSGSHRSYITDRLAKELGADMTNSEKLKIAVFGSNRVTLVDSCQIKLEISLRQPNESMPIWLNTSPIISDCDLSPGTLPDDAQRQIDSMKYAMADELNNESLDVLIGTDYMWCLVTSGAMPIASSLYCLPTSFGLVLTGRYETDEAQEQTTLFCLTERTTNANIMSSIGAISTITKTRPAIPDVDEFWSLEKIGIDDSPVRSDDEKALEQFNDTVYVDNGRYQVCWPWNENKNRLRSNYQMALSRLVWLGKRLAKSNKVFMDKYIQNIKTQCDAGIIERVPEDEVLHPKYTFHYLAHHPVIKVSDTTAVRTVYDASAKGAKDDVSLNECMYRGPVILPDLCSILIRFRLNRIALVSDIEKAFLQLSLQPSERDVTRFLWFEDVATLDPKKIAVYRFARVPFGIVSSPFLLGATIKHHLHLTGTPTATMISENVYVDNVITGTEDDHSALKFYTDAKTIFRDAAMNLRQWSSNSDTVMRDIPPEDRCKNRSVKVLGLNWDCVSDDMSLHCNWTSRANCQSKRQVLKAIASVYDPLGIFQPCTLPSKCFLRKLWNASLSWDDELSEELRHEWQILHTNIKPIFDIKLHRYVDMSIAPESTTIVTFCDASADAYATCVYLRAANSSGQMSTVLMYAKSRLTPKSNAKKDEISIPRLELLGLTIAASATKFVRYSLKTSFPIRAFVLCDSTIALSWLRSEKQQPVFIANRVKKIRDLDHAEFHHVAGPDNPADICTRGLSGEELKSSSLWWNGPDWLQDESSDWPTTTKIAQISTDDLRKIESKSNPSIFHCLTAGEGGDAWYPCGIDPKKHSSFRKLIRITAFWLKFVKWRVWDNVSDETKIKSPGLSRLFGDAIANRVVTAAELSISKKLWVKAVQSSRYHDVLTAIRATKPHPLVRQLDLYIDDEGLIRCAGRLQLADLPYDTIRPKLMPKTDHFTKLLIEDVHQKLLHSGVNHTLSQLRREYWIPHGRNAVRKVITRCIQCRKFKGPPFARPRMPPWPRERIAKSSPFQYCGVDYFGPINVATPCNHENRNTQKMWVCLYTCLSTRAISLEPVMDCTSISFIDCLSRFISRRGTPQMMISDNAPQFRLAKTLFDRTWQQVLTDDSVRSYISTKGILWKFTTALAPWQGGFYERMVGVVKSTLKSAIGRRLLKFEEFTTLIAEVESIVNSRPLTYVHSDIDSGLALRPIDFLTGLATGTCEVDPNTKLEGGDAGKNLLRYWKAKQRRLDLFWRHFYDEYVTSLRERGQTSHRNRRSDIHSVPKINEVVLVKNPDAPRGAWKVGKITRLIPSRDGLIRSVELLLPNKMTIERSVAFIYPLEIPSKFDEETIIPVANTDSSDLDEEFEGFEDADLDQIPQHLQFFDDIGAVDANSGQGRKMSLGTPPTREHPAVGYIICPNT